MDIPHKLLQVRILLAQYGLIAVLEKMSMPMISTVKGHRIPGQKPSHDSGNRYTSCSQEEMHMIAEQRPCVAGSGTSQQQLAKAIKKSVPITIFSKDRLPFDPSDDNVMQRPCSVYSRLTWHRFFLRQVIHYVNNSRASPSLPFNRLFELSVVCKKNSDSPIGFRSSC